MSSMEVNINLFISVLSLPRVPSYIICFKKLDPCAFGPRMNCFDTRISLSMFLNLICWPKNPIYITI